MKKSKRYLANLETFDKTKLYPIDEAVKLVKATSNTKFDLKEIEQKSGKVK